MAGNLFQLLEVGDVEVVYERAIAGHYVVQRHYLPPQLEKEGHKTPAVRGLDDWGK